MKHVHLDFETTSEADLRKVGVHAYSEHPTTRVIVVSWTVYDDDTRMGQSVVDYDPDIGGLNNVQLQPLFSLALDPTVIFHAWNAEFEHAIWNSQAFRLSSLLPHGGRTALSVPPSMGPDRFRCTMARAMYYGLPASLDDAGKALALPDSLLKDAAGQRLMMQMNKPRKRGNPSTWWHHDDPEKLKVLGDYCAKDVTAERAVAEKLPELPASEQKLWELNVRMNRIGVGVDRQFAMRLASIAERERAVLDAAMEQITGGEVQATSNVRQLGTFVAKRLNMPGVISLAAENLPKLERIFELTKDTLGAEVIKLRREAAKSSVAKLDAMLAVSEGSGKARGLIVYYGASRTGRYAGRLCQPHNYPRGKLNPDEVTLVANAVHGTNYEARFAHIKDVLMQAPRKTPLSGGLDIISSCLRAAFVPPPGATKFVGGDFSQIEARGIAWFGRQQKLLSIFAAGQDVYTYTALNVGSDNRQLGKVLVLACGFGMGPGKFLETARTYGIDLSPQQAEHYVKAWRAANPGIVSFWYDLERTVRQTIDDGVTRTASSVGVLMDGGHLVLRLPSGRRLYYRNAAAGETISYDGVNQRTRQWGREHTYGGKLAENVTQAMARDVMARALWKLTENHDWLLPVMTVHDEIVFGFDYFTHSETEALDTVKRYMETCPPWVPGLPVAADVKVYDRYQKG